MHVSPTSKRYPEMSEHERKLAESDAYLRKIKPKGDNAARQRQQLLQRREKPQFDKEAELSQISNWTGESQFNVGAAEMLKKKHQSKVLGDIYRTGLPDREQLVDTIVVLRQEKNMFEEEIRLLKVTCAKLKRQILMA